VIDAVESIEESEEEIAAASADGAEVEVVSGESPIEDDLADGGEVVEAVEGVADADADDVD